MITLKTWILALLVLFVVSANAQQQASSPLALTITADNKQVAAGSEVRLKIALTNTSSDQITVEDDGVFPYAVSVTRTDDKPVPLTERGKDLKEQQQLRTRGTLARIKRSFVTILPGRAQAGVCAISDWYNLSTTGDYSIQLQLNWKGGLVVSNVVKVSVVQ
jgi:hypothetical protein